MVDIETNPLYYAAVGGLVLGIATSLHYVLKGNVTGMSGIIYDVAFFNVNQFPNKLIIIGGIIMAGGIFFDIFGYQTWRNFTPFGPKQNISEETSFLGFALAGLLTGFGTKLGNGCTSGHGLCGLPRLSIRSFVAVAIFLSSAIGISTLRYYVTLGPFSENLSPQIDYAHPISANLCIAFGFFFLPIGFVIDKLYNKPNEDSSTILRDNLISFGVGLIFGTGLIVAGMARRRNIIFFLSMGTDWNPSLLFVLGCGVLLNLFVFNYMIRVRKTPLFGDKLFNPNNTLIDWKLVLGAFSFGLGWGIGGICPGPALVLLPVFQVQIHVIWLGCLIFGMYLATKLLQHSEKKVAGEIGISQQTTNIKDINKTTPMDPVQFSETIKLNETNSKDKDEDKKKDKPKSREKEEEKNKEKVEKQQVESYNLDQIIQEKKEEDKKRQFQVVAPPERIFQNCEVIEFVEEMQRQ